jgi:hypothetical protein
MNTLKSLSLLSSPNLWPLSLSTSSPIGELYAFVLRFNHTLLHSGGGISPSELYALGLRFNHTLLLLVYSLVLFAEEVRMQRR